MLKHDRHGDLCVDTGKGAGVKAAASGTDEPHDKYHQRVEQGAADVTSNHGVYRPAAEDGIGKHKQIFQTDQGEGGNEFAAVGMADVF